MKGGKDMTSSAIMGNELSKVIANNSKEVSKGLP